MKIQAQYNLEKKRKRSARSYAWIYLRRGKIKKLLCHVCGEPVAYMHHEDYRKPLEVKWLCRKHHSDLHYVRAVEPFDYLIGINEFNHNEVAKELLLFSKK